jgi:thiol-disulfide isomerase/thioredoxin
MKFLIISIISLCLLALSWLAFYPKTSTEAVASTSKSHLLKRQEFTLPDLDGQTQQFSQWNDKVVLLNFWATWCPPCRREIPDFIEVYEQYKDKDFIVVGIGIDDEERIADFIKQFNVSYPILVGGQTAMQVSKLYGNHNGALPYSILIDKNGVIRFRAGGLISRKKLLSQLGQLL